MEIIDGGKEEAVLEYTEDTFLQEMLLTKKELKTYVANGMITQAQYDKLIKEVT